MGEDDYLVAIDDLRDGRTQLIYSAGDLRWWLDTFRHGECLVPCAAICARCDRLHIDRDVDAELLTNCAACSGALLIVGAEMFLEREANRRD